MAFSTNGSDTNKPKTKQLDTNKPKTKTKQNEP